MRLSEIEKKARHMNIKDTWRLSKKDLIQAIQRQEGNLPCFSMRSFCEQLGCCWRMDCIK